MKHTYKIILSPSAERKLKYYQKKAPQVYKHISNSLYQLGINPFQQPLRTHKVNTQVYGMTWSSRVTGDVRILWEFYNAATILVVTIGGHDDVY